MRVTKLALIARAIQSGYYFDVLASRRGCLVFSARDDWQTFRAWSEVESWLNGKGV